MPEFIPEHTPDDVDAFTRGYLACAEWLAIADGPEHESDSAMTDAERDSCHEFTREAIAAAKRDCRDFQRFNKPALERYQEVTGRNLESAGHDFWLTRNRHGAGFWDRGTDTCLTRLTDAAQAYGECECEYYRRRLHLR